MEPSELQQLAKVFSDKHDLLLSELQNFITRSSEREEATLIEVERIHAAIVNMLDDAREAALDRNEVVVKSARKTAAISEKSAKFIGGTVLLVTVTIGLGVYSDPRDLAESVRKFLPAVGGLWLFLITSLFGYKKQELKENEPTRGDTPSP